ncbi:MAG: hypothetical protein GIX01_00340 [Candidatus Eremiobacteraeota bacterium]|nr:hypothetical protein [Candidatus Eremiobacteraeota bacterium]
MALKVSGFCDVKPSAGAGTGRFGQAHIPEPPHALSNAVPTVSKDHLVSLTAPHFALRHAAVQAKHVAKFMVRTLGALLER